MNQNDKNEVSKQYQIRFAKIVQNLPLMSQSATLAPRSSKVWMISSFTAPCSFLRTAL